MEAKKELSIGERIVAIARNEIGYVEKPGNDTKYGEWFNYNKKEWCAMFVSWCYFMADQPIKHGGFRLGFAGTQTGLKNFTEKGWRTDTPVPGDIVIYDFNANGIPEHTGIFVSWIAPGKTFKAIEGNTSDKSNSNGGMVMERERANKNVYFFHLVN